MRVTVIEDVRIRDGEETIEGDFHLPEQARCLVIFAHGSGSGRFSSRNRAVAEGLEAAGCATLLIDLLTRREEQVDVISGEYRFDIPLLGRRVVAAMDWAAQHPKAAALRVGLFGASTGAAAALFGAAARPQLTAAVVSRGGRPDLAGDAVLREVHAPTLLIVGGDDHPVIELNDDARRRMHAEARIEIIPGASHLFEEPGALEQVTRLASDWFLRHVS
jgi:dienelactone hydrolase